MKTLTEDQYALKGSVRRAVKKLGGCNAVADLVRVDSPRLSRYGNTDAPEFAPIDVCLSLDKELVVAGFEPEVMREYGRVLGFDITPREGAAAKRARDLTALMADAAKDGGELVSTTLNALSDGDLSINEAKAGEQIASCLEDRVVSIKAAFRARIKEAS